MNTNLFKISYYLLKKKKFIKKNRLIKPQKTSNEIKKCFKNVYVSISVKNNVESKTKCNLIGRCFRPIHTDFFSYEFMRFE